jgi:hypothetical protein
MDSVHVAPKTPKPHSYMSLCEKYINSAEHVIIIVILFESLLLSLGACMSYEGNVIAIN